jgi:hypothetical protein
MHIVVTNYFRIPKHKLTKVMQRAVHGKGFLDPDTGGINLEVHADKSTT